MTRINKLELRGFKSFANKTEFLFGEKFNVVLGPNGSGKSNVLDALTFVFGRSSSKAMRAEKSANLVYNGGKTKSPAKNAEVSIYFDNSQKTFPTDEKEVKISRIVNQKGNSIYKINDVKKTRQEVTELMGISKIDPEGYNIVLQGDVVKFVDLTPNDKRILIEEIAGIGVYEDKKEKALRELGKVDERVKEAEILLHERSTHLKELKKERDQALQYKELDDKIDKNKAAYLSMQMGQKRGVIEKLQLQIDIHEDKVSAFKSKISKCKCEISEKQSEITAINKEIEEKGEVEQVELNRDIEQIKIELATASTRIDSNKNEVGKVDRRIEELNRSLGESQDKIKRLNVEIKETEKDKSMKERELQSIEANIQKFKEKNKIGHETEALDREIESIDKESDEIQKQIQELRERQQELLREKDRSEFQLSSMNEKLEKIAILKKENKNQIEDLKKKREELKKISTDLDNSLDLDSSTSAQLGTARAKLARAQQELGRLSAQHHGIQEKTLGNRAIKAILDQKNIIKGIYGTVSELGEVNKKHALALEVAAGSRIKSIVVEDDKVAERCIKYLKDNQLGIATFLPLNKMKTRLIDSNVYELAKKSGVAGLAIDLVQYEPKFKNVFAHVFSNTMVVSDISTARAVGMGLTRMVTQSGDLVEISGAMIGGFRQKMQKEGGFQEKEINDSIKEYDEVVNSMSGMIITLEGRKADLDDKIVRLRQLKGDLEVKVFTLEKTLHLDEGDTNIEFGKVKQELQETGKRCDEELRVVLNKVSEMNMGFAKMKIRRQELRTKIMEMRDPAKLAELNAFEEKRQELMNFIVQIKADIKNIETQITSMIGPEQENIMRIVKQHTKERDDFIQESKSLSDRISILNKDLKEKQEKAKVFMAKFKGLFAQRDKAEETIRSLQRVVDENDLKSRESEMRVGGVSIEKAKYSAQLAGLEKEFEEYSEVDFSDVKKNEDELRREINKFENMMQNIGAVNMRALEVYDTIAKEFEELVSKKTTLETEKDDIFLLLNEIETRKKEIFMKTFDEVNKNFQKTFVNLSKKGIAHLELEDPENPFDGGMNIRVKLTSNRFMDIKSLSGGEKTMTTLAFLFAVQEYEPATFYVFDEVDAALDKSNSEKLAKLIQQYCGKAQYIVISHNDAVIGSADNLYGISMNEHGISKVTSLKI